METWISRRLEDQTPLGLCNQCFQCPYSYEMQALWEIQSSRSMGYWHYMEDNSVWCGGNSFKMFYSSNISSKKFNVWNSKIGKVYFGTHYAYQWVQQGIGDNHNEIIIFYCKNGYCNCYIWRSLSNSDAIVDSKHS